MSRAAAAPNFKVTVCVAEHIGDRADQQDRVAILTSPHRPGTLLAIVADGMGGRTGGRMASDQVMTTAKNLFEEPPDARNDAARAAGADRRRSACRDPPHGDGQRKGTAQHPGGGLLQKDSAVWIHAGDSRLYHFRDGAVAHKTIDHSYGSRMTADGTLVEGGPETDRFKNVLFSAIGIGHDLRLDYGSVEDLRPGDAFLLASDGLWAYFSERSWAPS
jgi:PPM family protein phosphatase